MNSGLVLSAQTLRGQLEAVARVVHGKLTIPVLSYVRFQPNGSKMRLDATSLDVALSTECEVTESDGQPFLLPVKPLVEFTKYLPDEAPVRFLLKDKKVEVSSQAYAGKWNTLPVDEFPLMPALPADDPWTFTPTFLTQVTEVERCTRHNDSRYQMAGALLEIRPGTLKLVATDGHRMALSSVPFEAGDRSFDAIIPRLALGHVKTFIAGDEPVQFRADDRFLFFEGGGRVLSIRRIDGSFPKYDRVLPTSTPIRSLVDRVALASAIRRIATVASKHIADDRGTNVTLSLQAKAIAVSASGPDVGEAIELVSADGPTKAHTVKFQTPYLLDFLDLATTPQISISLRDEMSAALWEPVGEAPTSYRYVVMPVRL